jgi:hypothetical protein
MNKSWHLLLALVLGVLLGGSSAHAISVAFDPASQTVQLGDTVTVGIKISGLTAPGAPSLSAFDLDVSFNSSILSLASVSFGDPVLGDQLDLGGFGCSFLPGLYCDTAAGVGSVNLFELSADSSADLDLLQAADFILATLSFNTAGTGTSPLTLSLNSLVSSENRDQFGNACDPDQTVQGIFCDPVALTADSTNGSVTVESRAAVPEPATFFLLGSGLIGLAAWGRRRQRS